MKSGCAFIHKLHFAAYVFSRYIALINGKDTIKLEDIAAAITSRCQIIIIQGKGVQNMLGRKTNEFLQGD